MKIELKKGKLASDEPILALQAALGCQISDSFRSFLRGNDGAEPETNIFKITEKNESGVNQFIPVSEILKERGRIEDIPRTAYPIAWAEGGNYVFVDEGKNGAVFFLGS
jgi:SMI1 / KNR4 family (SUKH-1)